MPAASAQFNGFIPTIREAFSVVEPKPASAPGLFTRMFNAIHASQTRRAERDIARFIEASGGRMTDDLERKIERHFV